MRKTLFKSMTAACIAFMLLFALVPVVYAADSDPAVLDTNASLFAALEAIGRQHADPNFYTVGELTGDLNLTNRGITSVAGLENCVGITRLILSANDLLTDIAPFNGASMPALQELYLDRTGIAALPANLQMPVLDTLDLSRTPVDDAGLAGIGTGSLPQLHNLFLEKCLALHNITSLSAVTTLQKLFLSEAGLTDLPVSMAGMTSLTDLFINGHVPEYDGDTKGPVMPVASFIDSVATLPKFKNANGDLVSLNISNTDVVNASFLNGCSGIKTLIWEYQDNPPSVFPNAANLYNLDVSNNPTLGNGALASIAADMPLFHAFTPASPATLVINATGVTDVSNLSSADGLRTLSWMFTPSLTAATGLDSLTQLTGVDLSYDTGLGNAAVTSVAPLPAIQSLAAMGCGISDLTALAGKNSFRMLFVGENNITSLAPLVGMDLNMLYVHNNLIHDLAPLAGMANLTILNVALNHIDTTAGSPDRTILDTIAARPGSYVTYNPQLPQPPQPPPPPVLSADSTLAGLTASQPMTPAFEPATLAYSVALPGAADHVTLTATPAAGATCTIDGAAGPSRDISVGPGQTKAVPIVVTAQNGYDKTTYTVTVTRATPDKACKLTGIALSPAGAALSPAFSSSITAYTVTLPANAGSATITPAKPEKATMTIDGAAAASVTVSLKTGEKKQIAVVVTAENGKDKTTYRLTVVRADAARLASLGAAAGTLSPAFDPYKTSYTLTLPKGIGSVTLKPVKAAASSKLYINGKLASSKTFKLAPGKSVKVTVKVKSASGASCTYTINIKR